MHNDNEMGLHFKYPVVLRRKKIWKEEHREGKVKAKWGFSINKKTFEISNFSF